MKRHPVLDDRTSTMIRALLGCLTAVGLIAVMHSPAPALVVAQPNPPTTWPATDVPPADDPGWSNVTVSGRNYVYLGDGWALSARHVGPANGETLPGMSPQSLTFSTGTFQIIPGQNFVVRNPATTVNSSGQTVNLTTETDLRLVRLNGDPGLPSIFGPDAAFTISTTPIPYNAGNSEVVLIGHGRSRDGDLRHWIPSSTDSWAPTTPCASQSNSCRSGYDAVSPNDDTKRWGKNRLANANNYKNSGAFSEVLSTTTGILPLDGFGGVTRDVASLVTAFDLSGTVNEAQAVDKDSGTAVFYKRGGQWELSGIVNAVLTYENQPSLTAVYGNATTIADLSFYYHPDPLSDFTGSISDVIRENPNYSVMGDINLDGIVNGNGSGPWASDDVAAFAAGWMYQQPTGDVTSWKKGDLNLDGITNVVDFFLLRGALQSAGAGAGIANLSDILGSGAGVPEPSALLLAVMGAGLAAGGRRRRSRRAAA